MIQQESWFFFPIAITYPICCGNPLGPRAVESRGLFHWRMCHFNRLFFSSKKGHLVVFTYDLFDFIIWFLFLFFFSLVVAFFAHLQHLEPLGPSEYRPWPDGHHHHPLHRRSQTGTHGKSHSTTIWIVQNPLTLWKTLSVALCHITFNFPKKQAINQVVWAVLGISYLPMNTPSLTYWVLLLLTANPPRSSLFILLLLPVL